MSCVRARAAIFGCMVWLLGGLLIAAALDKVADPMATSPRAQSPAAAVHEHLVDSKNPRVPAVHPEATPRRTDAGGAPEPAPLRRAGAPIDYAADPSPPVC